MKKRSFLEKFAAVPHLVWVLLFIVAPLFFVVYFAFTDSYGNFTTDNIAMLSGYAHIFVLSVCFALIATAICLLIAYPLAYFLSQLKPTTQKVMIVLLMLPMWISLLIRTYSLMALLDNGGLLNALLGALGLPKVKIVGTAGAVILGMVYDFLPYMVLPIYTSMSKLDTRYLEAANDLGCNNVKTMFRVVLPLSMPGVISGITMVFVPSISTFYISQKLGGGSFDLIGDTIERQFQNVSTYNIGAAISLVMMILIVISVTVMNRFSDDGEEIIV
ncbi:MAG: ABC transporter permease [Ruminococcaceae bacterium]|nr:ABC transporter permease [Oscillospiraceae bacterium]